VTDLFPGEMKLIMNVGATYAGNQKLYFPRIEARDRRHIHKYQRCHRLSGQSRAMGWHRFANGIAFAITATNGDDGIGQIGAGYFYGDGIEDFVTWHVMVLRPSVEFRGCCG
jgi:hypothetical protein